jgi:hypothetical protein
MHKFYQGKKQPKNVGYFCDFQKAARSKQSPKRAKIRPNLVTLATTTEQLLRLFSDRRGATF